MKSRLSYLLFCILSFSFLFGQKITIEDIYEKGTYSGESFRTGRWIENGTAWLVTERDKGAMKVMRHDFETDEETLFFDGADVEDPSSGKPVSITSFALSPDENLVLISKGRKKIWRRSSQTTYYLFNRSTGKTVKVAKGDELQSSGHFSPDNGKIGYVQGNNIYIYTIATGKTKRITKDGEFAISNGQADWLYEEEFRVTRAYEWSPDSKQIIYVRYDQRHLKHYPMLDEMKLYPTTTLVQYPKVGERNSIIKVGIANVKKGKTKWINIGSEQDIYVPRIFWTGQPGQAAFYRLNRRQNFLELIMVDAKTGKTTVATSQKNTTGWVDVSNPIFINGGDEFIWTHEESGYRHIYRYKNDGTLLNAVTSGDWEVSNIIGVDEANNMVYLNGKKDHSTQSHVYRATLDGGQFERISPAGGSNYPNFTPDFSHFILRHTALNTPGSVTLHRSNGEMVRTYLADSNPTLSAMDLAKWEIFDLETTDGTLLNASILKPKDFDPNKKYPTLINTYAVTSAIVGDRFGSMWDQFLVQEGYVVMRVDNRGTSGRGKKFSNYRYGDLGKWPLHDQIEGAKWIGRQSWGDADRIGIWGGSGGGYTTAYCMTAGAKYFKAGIASSSVTDWRLYDTAWTERYHGLLSEHEDGYEASSAMNHVDNYNGGLLIIHGTADDNVHVQNSWQLIQALIKANKQFDMQFYPNLDHGLRGTSYHRAIISFKFWEERLK